jgi:allophanate hydrolase
VLLPVHLVRCPPHPAVTPDLQHLKPPLPLPAAHTGAINFGKTNLDQFASGLVGTRTPYGVAPNAFDNRFIPGGSSSGSAAAVGGGLLSFALGTDTAGSGRVPAMYNGCVGLKGSLGKISTVGE